MRHRRRAQNERVAVRADRHLVEGELVPGTSGRRLRRRAGRAAGSAGGCRRGARRGAWRSAASVAVGCRRTTSPSGVGTYRGAVARPAEDAVAAPAHRRPSSTDGGEEREDRRLARRRRRSGRRGGGGGAAAWRRPGRGPAERLELLGRDDEHAAQVARAVAVAALLADARLLLGGQGCRVPEREAAMLVADAVDVAGALAGSSPRNGQMCSGRSASLANSARRSASRAASAAAASSRLRRPNTSPPRFAPRSAAAFGVSLACSVRQIARRRPGTGGWYERAIVDRTPQG